MIRVNKYLGLDTTKQAQVICGLAERGFKKMVGYFKNIVQMLSRYNDDLVFQTACHIKINTIN